MGRNRIEIDWGQFDKLCAMQSTQEEIAGWFNCSVDTIDRAVKRQFKKPFAEVFAQKRRAGRVSLRRALFQNALDGNPTMQIWLSKQHLEMSDKIEQKVQAHVSHEMTDAEIDARLEELEKREIELKGCTVGDGGIDSPTAPEPRAPRDPGVHEVDKA